MELVSGLNLFGVNRNRQNKRTSRICHGAATPSFGLLAHVSCWVSIMDVTRGLCMTQPLYNLQQPPY